MITTFRNLEKVDDIVSEAYHRRKELPVESFRRHLIDCIVKNDSYIKIDNHNDEVVGFMFATVEEYEEEPVAFIQEAFTTEKGKTSLKDLLMDLEIWAKSKGLKGLFFFTKRNPKAWTRKYGFCKEAIIMTRRF